MPILLPLPLAFSTRSSTLPLPSPPPHPLALHLTSHLPPPLSLHPLFALVRSTAAAHPTLSLCPRLLCDLQTKKYSAGLEARVAELEAAVARLQK